MLESRRTGDRLCVHLRGELDHCAADAMRGELEAMLRDPGIRQLWLDFTDVSFMDSSGVGMIGRYKTMKSRGGSVCACGLNPQMNRLFHLAGLHRIICVMGGQGEHE